MIDQTWLPDRKVYLEFLSGNDQSSVHIFKAALNNHKALIALIYSH